jgi:uncharacterized protein
LKNARHDRQGAGVISNNSEGLSHSQFLTSVALFEGGLLAIAFLGGWFFDCPPTATLNWSLTDFGLGLLATVPMLVVLMICVMSRSEAMKRIRTFQRDTVGQLLDECRWYDIALLALLAGVCEEVLFRGFLYLWLARFNSVIAVLISNLAFGAAHAATAMYGILAAFMGLYLTALIAVDPTPNLLIPITAHTVYDIVAFAVVLYDYRQQDR